MKELKIICKGSVESFKALKRTKLYKNFLEKGIKIQFKLYKKILILTMQFMKI